MRNRKRILYIAILGILAAFTVLTVQRCIVRAARVQHASEAAPYFPPGSPWTQDISQEPVDPQSTAMIDWLADNGGWGNRNRFQIDFSIRVLTADASTPKVRFHRGSTWYSPDSDLVSEIPLPKDGGLEGQTGYRCNGGDCHLIVVDRAEGKLYEAFAADYADNAMSATFLGVWDLNKVYPPTGRGNQCTSADAAGLPIAPLLFNADELAAGSINHAMRFALPPDRIEARAFVHPATHAIHSKGPEQSRLAPNASNCRARSRMAKSTYRRPAERLIDVPDLTGNRGSMGWHSAPTPSRGTRNAMPTQEPSKVRNIVGSLTKRDSPGCT